MDNFETVLMIDKIKFQKNSEGLIEDITTIIDRYNAFSSSPVNDVIHILLCNVYKCLTLAISLYITKCSSPLPAYMYKVKYSMEQEILSEEFLNTDKPTYEWLIDTFQYTADIQANILNSTYAQYSNKQTRVKVKRNMNYVILNKLALLVKDKIIPFTIDFNSRPNAYYGHLISTMAGPSQQLMEELACIQTLKARADNSITYTLFEEVLDEKLEELSSLKIPLNFMDTVEKLRESIRVMEVLDSKYTKHLKIKDKNDNTKNTL